MEYILEYLEFFQKKNPCNLLIYKGLALFVRGVGRKGATLFADKLNHFLSSSETIMNKGFQRFLLAEK